MCLALVALALDLVWGYAGILSLGHGLYFALGGYAFGMYLMRQSAGDGLPDFMRFLSWTELPWFWVGTNHFWWAMILVVLVPGLIAFIFGFFAFRSKIKGVYFSIITQAMTFAAALLFFRNETGFAGITVYRFQNHFRHGHHISTDACQPMFYHGSGVIAVLCWSTPFNE